LLYLNCFIVYYLTVFFCPSWMASFMGTRMIDNYIVYNCRTPWILLTSPIVVCATSRSLAMENLSLNGVENQYFIFFFTFVTILLDFFVQAQRKMYFDRLSRSWSPFQPRFHVVSSQLRRGVLAGHKLNSLNENSLIKLIM
jgi:hypothetical protein